METISKIDGFELLLCAEGFKGKYIHNKFREMFQLNKTKQEKIGTIVMNAEGLRKLAHSMDMIYSAKTKINMPIWEDEQKGLLFMQLEKNTGEISLVD